MKKGIQITLILVLLMFNSMFSQELNSLRKKSLQYQTDTIRFDSLSVIPGSLSVFNSNGSLIEKDFYEINYVKSTIVFKKKPETTTFSISYKVFPYDLSKPFFNKDPELISYQSDSFNNYYIYKPISSGGILDFADSKLKKQGSISRGVSFGNSQDVIVNSSLNLQLSGQLSDDLEILAAITDNNIPIQPDGTSQQIQEFDKVFISVFNKKMNLTVGDFEIRKPSGFFMNLNKKVQGASFTNIFTLNEEKNSTLKSTISGAVAKGKYNRMSFNGMEGNQGPYRLTGANNEMYIIVLAGTEKVYIDGKLLTRGQENDYVIDYNTAELTFTPRVPITKDKRILVEFEYSDRNYARFLVHNANEFISEKSSFRINIFSEQDSKNQPLQQELSDEQKSLLSETGDSLSLAVFPNIDSIGFDNNYVMYKKIDTLVSGVTYTDIYVYSTNPDSAFYRLGFSSVGANKGNYKQEISSANGKVYKWIAPVGGIPQGSYEPVILLITPKKKQMATFGGTYDFSKNTSLEVELAITNNDLNTFSNLHSNDNAGYAMKTSFLQKIPLKDTLTRLSTNISYLFTDKNFDPVERFRNIEFERDWNLGKAKLDEHFLEAGIELSKPGKYKSGYQFEIMKKESMFNAIRNNLNSLVLIGGFKLDITGSYLNTTDLFNYTSFLRQKSSLSRSLSGFNFGVRTESEENIWKRKSNDSLLANSFSYLQYEIFSETEDSIKTGYFLSYKNRKDKLPGNEILNDATTGEDFGAGLKFLKNQNNRLQTSINYRRLQINDTTLTSNQEENSVTGRIDYSLRLLKGAIAMSTFYETGSGMELKKEFSYLEVSPGQGVYTWSDYNGNGVKEIDEFEIAAFQDQANYIRIFTPTSEYIRTANNQFSQQLNLMPSKIWRKEKGLRKFLTRFSDQFAYNVNQKKLSKDLAENLNPFSSALSDTNLISFGNAYRNTFSFNRTSSVFGADLLYNQNNNRILLLNGLDTRSNKSTGLYFRWNINKTIMLSNKISQSLKTYESEFFESKNYRIPSNENQAALQFQFESNTRIKISHTWSQKHNENGNEKALKNDAGIEIRHNVVNKGSLQVNFNYIIFDYNEPTNTSIAYTMLEGLLPGKNSTWTVAYQRSISGGLQLNISYSGRKSEDSKTVHIGGVQLRAFF